MATMIKDSLKALLPDEVYRPIATRWRHLTVRWGNLRRLEPLSRHQFVRGEPIDRYYIHKFLEKNQRDIQGRVVEVADATYTLKYGQGRVTKSEILHVDPGDDANPTIVGDITQPGVLETEAYDCLLFTQVFAHIFDLHAAVKHCHESLRPGGVLLTSMPGIAGLSRFDYDRWGDRWRFTDMVLKELFGKYFGEENVEVTTYGNVLVGCAYLHCMGAEELTPRELDHVDPDYQVFLSVRAVKR